MERRKILTIVLIILIIVNMGLLVGIVLQMTSKSTCEAKIYANEERIVGGQRVRISSYPATAAILVKQYTFKLQCGCCIISSKWVATAAHCIAAILQESFTNDMVFISSNNADWTKGKKHSVVDWVSHDKYKDASNTNDIALIKVKQPFTEKYEKPAAVANVSYPYKPNTKVTVTGWGRTVDEEDAPVQKLLRGVDIKIIDQRQCMKLYSTLSLALTSDMVCAGLLEGGKDACQFDSGGPLYDNGLLIGLVSWGVECAQKNQPGVYTRVSLHEQWIRNTIKKFKDPIDVQFKNKP